VAKLYQGDQRLTNEIYLLYFESVTKFLDYFR